MALKTNIFKRFKIICKDVFKTPPSVSHFDQSWDRLPLEIAMHIYRLLPMNDKRNMSLTCKFWLAVFGHPTTWRYFVFTGNTASNLEIPIVVFSSLQCVTIDCSVRSCDLSEEYIMEKANRLIAFVVGLKKSRNKTLQELNIWNMKDLDYSERSCLHKHLIKLLAKQTKLCKLSVFNGEFRNTQGLQILAAAGQNSAHSLKYLNVHNYSKRSSPLGPELTFAQLCGAFTNLTVLSINSAFKSDELLTHLPGTLKLIIVWIHMYDFYYPAFHHKSTEHGWNVLVSKCNGLKAEYHVELPNLDLISHMSWTLSPLVPMASYHWTSQGGDPNTLRRCFDEFITTHKNDLEHVHVDVGFKIFSDLDVAAVIERCPLLKTFSINGTAVPLKPFSKLESIMV